MKHTFLVVFVLAFFQGQIQAQKQIGSDIYNGNDGDYFGQTVSISADGSRILTATDTYNSRIGLVRVYEWNTDSLDWIQLGQDLSGELAETRYGRGADISDDGTTIAIGKWTGDGIVQVFRLVNNEWTQIGLTIDGSYYQNRHGYALELSADGNRIAVGAYQGAYGGEINIYEFDGSVWNRLGSFIQGNLDYSLASDNFGWSLGLSDNGNRVIAGGWGNDGPNLDQSNLGHVKIFDLVDTSWVQVGQTLYGDELNDGLGYSVTISGDGSRIVAAAPNNYSADPIFRYSGYVRVYELIDSTWILMGNEFRGPGPYNFYGNSVSLSQDGSILAFSATGHDNDSLNTGKVFLYKYDGSEWQPLGGAIQGVYTGEEIGYDIYLTADGSKLISSSIKSDRYGIDAGFSAVYETGLNWSLNLSELDIIGDEDKTHLTNHTPEFSYEYDHSDSLELQKLQFQVSTSPDFAIVDMWDSGLITISDSMTVYSGDSLVDGTTYYIRAKAESFGYESEWVSDSFRMNTPPQNPQLLSSFEEPITELPIEFSFLKGSDPEGDSLTYYMRLYEDDSYTTVIDSAVIKQELPDTVHWELTIEIPDSITYHWGVQTFDGFEFSEPMTGTLQTGTIVSNETDNESPDTFSLSQNYPNPFNPTTNIQFSLPQTTDVKLEVFNILGMKVSTLIDDRVLAGEHQVLFDAATLSSGVYFYRITTNTHTKTMRMLLLK